jgi:hypothetical protein
MANPNIVSVTSIYGKTSVQIVSNTATAIVTNSAGSNKVIKVNALYISNVDPANNNSITVDIFRSSVAYKLSTAIVVPFNSTLDVISKSIYLEEGDALRLTSAVAGANKLEAVCSSEEIS